MVFRIQSEGGSRDALREVMTAHKEAFERAGYGARARTALNSDGSLDGEVRVDLSGISRKDQADRFREAILTLGDIVHLPGSL